jgi:gp16 family phage-associated protein
MKKSTPVPGDLPVTPITVREIWASGSTVKAWAVERGFSAHLVYQVLRGERKCLRGESRTIAKELGMK